MHLTMLKLALILPCMAVASQGRRGHTSACKKSFFEGTSVLQYRSNPPADGQKSLEADAASASRLQSGHESYVFRFNRLKVFAMLLQSLDPALAFLPRRLHVSPGVHHAKGSATGVVDPLLKRFGERQHLRQGHQRVHSAVLLSFQEYDFEYQKAFDGTKTYMIESVNAPGKYLSVKDREIDNGADIRLLDDPEPALTQWRISSASVGVFTIQNANACLCLNVEGNAIHDGANIILWDNPESSSSQWRILKRDGEDVFTIGNINARGKYLSVEGDKTQNGANIHLSGDLSAASALWRIIPDLKGSGSRKFDAEQHGRLIDKQHELEEALINEAWRSRFGMDAPQEQRNRFVEQTDRSLKAFIVDYLAKIDGGREDSPETLPAEFAEAAPKDVSASSSEAPPENSHVDDSRGDQLGQESAEETLMTESTRGGGRTRGVHEPGTVRGCGRC